MEHVYQIFFFFILLVTEIFSIFSFNHFSGHLPKCEHVKLLTYFKNFQKCFFFQTFMTYDSQVKILTSFSCFTYHSFHSNSVIISWSWCIVPKLAYSRITGTCKFNIWMKYSSENTRVYEFYHCFKINPVLRHWFKIQKNMLYRFISKIRI